MVGHRENTLPTKTIITDLATELLLCPLEIEPTLVAVLDKPKAIIPLPAITETTEGHLRLQETIVTTLLALRQLGILVKMSSIAETIVGLLSLTSHPLLTEMEVTTLLNTMLATDTLVPAMGNLLLKLQLETTIAVGLPPVIDSLTPLDLLGLLDLALPLLLTWLGGTTTIALGIITLLLLVIVGVQVVLSDMEIILLAMGQDLTASLMDPLLLAGDLLLPEMVPTALIRTMRLLILPAMFRTLVVLAMAVIPMATAIQARLVEQLLSLQFLVLLP
jgi:hypothetical protein